LLRENEYSTIKAGEQDKHESQVGYPRQQIGFITILLHDQNFSGFTST
jgi:hypothetical protein